MSDAHSLSAGGRSTRLVEVVLRSYSNCYLYPEVTLVVLQTQKFFLSGNHKQQRQGVFSYVACLLCVPQHNRYEKIFKVDFFSQCSVYFLDEGKLLHMCDISAETITRS